MVNRKLFESLFGASLRDSACVGDCVFQRSAKFL
jgi:hypothetical protein